MTSSLVGSEMCIRDSHAKPRRMPSCGRRASQCRGSAWYSSRIGPCLPESCLLYTSDAADDM
eukprot:4862424-Prorocentrum_lima.AAC.1